MNLLAILLGIVLLVVAATIAAIHLGFRAPRLREQGSPADLGLAFDSVWIPTARDKRLFAWWLPAGDAAPTLLMLHGWGGNAEVMLPLAAPLRRAGFNLLLLDARNHGRSDADGHSSLPRFAEDVDAALDWLKRRDGARAPVALLGHSVGAGAVLLAASRRDDIAAVIAIAAFAHPEWTMRRYLDRRWLPRALRWVILRYVEWVIGHRYADIAPMNRVCHLRCPVLLVHGTRDSTVPVSDALAIQENCPTHRPELLLIEDAGHDSVEEIERHADKLIRFLDKATR